MLWRILAIVWLVFSGEFAAAQSPPPRCIIQTDSSGAFQFLVDGMPRAVWHGKTHAKRPFFFPLVGPSGQSVTRMGHPGAPDHDHHCSVWFAHFKVNGLDFWSENGATQIVQSQWLALEDGEDSCRMAVLLHWLDPEGKGVMQQQLVCQMTPFDEGETLLEVQADFTPFAGAEEVTLEKTNFGLFAVRVSKSLSNVFGHGCLTSDSGSVGEPNIFEGRHRWVDYSGLSPIMEGSERKWFEEGITYFDHPSNAGFPSGWHVRNDGWMCASPTMFEDRLITSDRPMRVRYLLHIHSGAYDGDRANAVFQRFANTSAFQVERSKRPHVRFEISRD